MTGDSERAIDVERLDLDDIAAQDTAGAAVIGELVGAVVAFLGAIVLSDFGATRYTVNLVAFAFLREFGVLQAAIILAGRIASAFTAQIGSMKANEELDAQLIDTRRGRVLASRRFSLNQLASGEIIEAVIETFGLAADYLDQQLVDWTIMQLEETAKRP